MRDIAIHYEATFILTSFETKCQGKIEHLIFLKRKCSYFIIHQTDGAAYDEGAEEGNAMADQNPFTPFSDWTKHWQQFFQTDFWGSIQPLLPSANKPSSGMNLYKKDNELLIVISLPGLEKIEDAEVYVSYKTLEVKATVNLNFKGFELVEEGIFQGRFEKTVPLPFPVKEDRIEATYHHGLLFIHLHRLIPEEPKKKIMIKKGE